LLKKLQPPGIEVEAVDKVKIALRDRGMMVKFAETSSSRGRLVSITLRIGGSINLPLN
jgi:hypothetical protein